MISYSMDIQKVRIGDFVELNGSLGVVVGVATSEAVSAVPEGHLAVWFGPEPRQSLLEREANNIPKVWTVPAEYCSLASTPQYYH